MTAGAEGRLLGHVGLVVCCLGLLGSAVAAAVTLQKLVAAELRVVTDASDER